MRRLTQEMGRDVSGRWEVMSVLGVGFDELSSDVGMQLLVQRSDLAPHLFDGFLERVRLEIRPPIFSVVRETSTEHSGPDLAGGGPGAQLTWSH